MVFQTNMRRNYESDRLNPLSFNGHSYSKDEKKTAVSALTDAGLYTIEPCEMKVRVNGEWQSSTYRELMRTPMQEDFAYRSFGTVGKDYRPVQPETVAYLWDRHVKDDDGNPVPITTVRQDRFGERLIFSHEIMKFEVKARHEAKKGDELSSHVVFDVPFIPGAAISLSSYILRLACTNGATRQDSKWIFRVPHMGNPEQTLAEMLLLIYAYSKREAQLDNAIFNELAQKLLNPVEINWLLTTTYPDPKRPVNEAHPRYTSMVETYETEKAKMEGYRHDVKLFYEGAGIGADVAALGTPYWFVQCVAQLEGDKRTSSRASMTVDMLPGGERASTISKSINNALKLVRGEAKPELEPVYVR